MVREGVSGVCENVLEELEALREAVARVEAVAETAKSNALLALSVAEEARATAEAALNR